MYVVTVLQDELWFLSSESGRQFDNVEAAKTVALELSRYPRVAAVFDASPEEVESYLLDNRQAEVLYFEGHEYLASKKG